MSRKYKGEKPKCPECGADLVSRNGKYGWFWGCSAFPKCSFSKSMNTRTQSTSYDDGYELGSWGVVGDVYDQSDFY